MSYVSISKPVKDGIVQASQSSDNEVIGLLLGGLENDTIVIEDRVTGEYSGEPTRVQLLPSTLAKIADDILAGRVKGNIVGWYHSHPTGGVFFSETDTQTQKSFQQFSRLTVGMVVDSQTGEVGYFRVDQVGAPFRIPEEKIKTYDEAPAASEVAWKAKVQMPRLTLPKKLIEPKVIFSIILIALVASLAFFGAVLYRTSSNSAAPTITEIPISAATVGQTIPVTANVTGNIQGVTLFYQPENSTAFTAATMNSTVVGTYEYSIPGSSVTGDIIYYIKVSSTNGAVISTDVHHIRVADFRPQLHDSTLIVYRNSTTSVTSQLLLEPINGFDQSLSLSSHPPQGLSASIPSSAPAGTSVPVSIKADVNTPTGTYSVLITASYSLPQSGWITRQTTLQVTVTDFAIYVTPTANSIVPGMEANYNVTLNAAPGFSAPITITESSLPANTKAVLLSGGTVLTGAGLTTSVLQISTNANTPAGTFTITVVATATVDMGNYIVHSQTIELTVR